MKEKSNIKKHDFLSSRSRGECQEAFTPLVYVFPSVKVLRLHQWEPCGSRSFCDFVAVDSPVTLHPTDHAPWTLGHRMSFWSIGWSAWLETREPGVWRLPGTCALCHNFIVFISLRPLHVESLFHFITKLALFSFVLVLGLTSCNCQHVGHKNVFTP